MPQKAEHTIHILEGAATLYQRPTTPHWFVRYKADGKWQRTTTKCEELAKAKLKAAEIVGDANFKQRYNIPVVSKRFKAVAIVTIKTLEELLANNVGKVVYKDYIRAINKYIIPFFGAYNIDKIDYLLIKKFADMRTKEFGRIPNASTINTHNAALNRIFDTALERGYITKSQIPYLKNEGLTANKGTDFTKEEYVKLYKFMRTWVKQARKGHETELRLLLRDYVLILVNTGIRAGTEAMNLKWKNIGFFEEGGKRYLSLNVIGKVKKYREVTVRHRVARYLQRIQERNTALKDMAFEDAIALGSSEYVFRVNGKDMTTAFGRVFKRLLIAADLLEDRRNGIERTLYSCRHTYATMTLTDTKITTYVLAKHMGTSEAMIKAHYEHIEMRGQASEIAGGGSIEGALRKTREIRKG
jgi:integrase